MYLHSYDQYKDMSLPSDERRAAAAWICTDL